MSPARFAMRNSLGVLLSIVFLAALGAFAIRGMPASILPNFPFPRLVVVVQAGELAIQDMIVRVTRPLEEAAGGVPGAKRVYTKTARGSMEMSVDFDWGTPMFEAYTRLNANVAGIRSALPAEASVLVERMDPSSFPVIGYSLTSDRDSARALRETATLELAPTLSRLEGVYRVTVQGGKRREWHVELDPALLARYGLTPEAVSLALADTNILESVGRFARHYQGYLVLVTGQFARPEDLLSVVVSRGADRPVRVSDIGRVLEGDAPTQQLVTADGHEAVLLNILQQPGASTSDVSRRVREELARLKPSLPAGMRTQCFYDEAELLNESTDSLRDSILTGALLALAVLLLALRSVRTVAIVILSLPPTVLISFLALKLLGQSLNIMTLGGLAVGLGLIIDDVLVTLENVYRHVESGLAPFEAAELGAAEILKPMVGSTFSTVAVFLPLVFLTEITGAFFAPLAVTLTILLLVSVLLSISVVPALSAHLLKRGASTSHSHRDWRSAIVLGDLAGAAARRPVLALLPALIFGCSALWIYGGLPSGFMPDMDEGAFVIDYMGAPGATLVDTDRQSRLLEAEIERTPEIAAYARRQGLEMGFFTTEPNRGDIMVKLKPRSARKRSMREVMEDLEGRCSARLPGMTIEAIAPIADRVGDIAGEPSPIEIKFFGDDPIKLQDLAERAATIVASVRGASESVHGISIAGPELEVRVDPFRAGLAGLSARGVADSLRSSLEGAHDTIVRNGERLIPVRVQYPRSDWRRMDQIERLPLSTSGGRSVSLNSVATLTSLPGAYEAIRENQLPMVPVTASLIGRDLGSANAEVRSRIARDLPLPAGYTLQYGGLYLTQQKSFESLLSVLGMGGALVFIVTLFQYNRLREPVALMVAGTLALASVVWMLHLTSTALNASSFTGGIMVFGMVLTNGIVLMDTVRHLTDGGADLTSAVAAAVRRRVRPVFMTSAVAILALLPLSLGLGAGAEMQRPLAVAVIGGLLTAPIFTLIVSPSVLVLLSRRTAGSRGHP